MNETNWLCHSSARGAYGPRSKHKYIRIENGRYIYPEDLKSNTSYQRMQTPSSHKSNASRSGYKDQWTDSGAASNTSYPRMQTPSSHKSNASRSGYKDQWNTPKKASSEYEAELAYNSQKNNYFGRNPSAVSVSEAKKTVSEKVKDTIGKVFDYIGDTVTTFTDVGTGKVISKTTESSQLKKDVASALSKGKSFIDSLFKKTSPKITPVSTPRETVLHENILTENILKENILKENILKEKKG